MRKCEMPKEVEMTEMRTIKGVIHGRTIELREESGWPDGQEVDVAMWPVLPPGEGIRQSAGAWEDAGEELDAWLEEMRRSRQRDRPELP
jgi:hypothetical protein